MVTPRTRKRMAIWLAYAVIIALCIIEILPIYWIVITSFKTNLDIFGGHPLTPPIGNATLEHYQYVFKPAGTSSVGVGAYLVNSILVTFGTIAEHDRHRLDGRLRSGALQLPRPHDNEHPVPGDPHDASACYRHPAVHHDQFLGTAEHPRSRCWSSTPPS